MKRLGHFQGTGDIGVHIVPEILDPQGVHRNISHRAVLRLMAGHERRNELVELPDFLHGRSGLRGDGREI